METLFGGDARVQITMDQKNRHVQLRDMSNRGPLAGLIIVAHVGDIVRDTWFGCGSFPLGNIGDRFICHHRFQVWRLGGCKQGDLAVIVRSIYRPECVGAIVRCIEYKPNHDGAPAWIIDRELGPPLVVGGLKRLGDWWSDALLRPLRDNDGTDETLTWRDVPRKVAA